jgi:hypothetical protein
VNAELLLRHFRVYQMGGEREAWALQTIVTTLRVA